MEIVVGSKHLHSSILTALDVTGREHLVVITKGSWQIPEAGQRPRPVTPDPLHDTDLHVGEPGLSAMLYGSDYVRFKPRCDVLFNASAHAPEGKPVRDLLAGWQVGELRKGLRAVGCRVWHKHAGEFSLSEPEPFLSCPLHYGLALGGCRDYQKGNATLSEALLTNPVGSGWAGRRTIEQLHLQPAPRLEAHTQPIRHPHAHDPVAFSAVGRHWEPRKQYVGTYDSHWEENIFPFLPEDFDEQFHQCAPMDQQMPYPQGGEEVVLFNMLPGGGERRFRLPVLNRLQVRVLRKDYSVDEPTALADTLYFDLNHPEGPRFSVVWRTSLPIRRRIQEFDTIAVGPVNAQWWQDKVLGINSGGCSGCSKSPEPDEVNEASHDEEHESAEGHE